MIGSLGVFIAGDLVSFYLRLCFGQPPGLRPVRLFGRRRKQARRRDLLAFAILGEALLLLAFALLAAGEPRCKRAHRRCDGRPARLAVAGRRPGAGRRRFRHENGTDPVQRLDAAELCRRADPRRRRAQRRGRQGRRDRADPLPAARRPAARLGRGAGRARLFHRLLWRACNRPDPAQSQNIFSAYSSISQMGAIAAAFGFALGGGRRRRRATRPFRRQSFAGEGGACS